MAPKKKAAQSKAELVKKEVKPSTEPVLEVVQPSTEPEKNEDKHSEETKHEVIFLNLRIPGTQYALTIDTTKKDCKEPPHCHTYFIISERNGEMEEMDEVSLESCIFKDANPKTPLNLRRVVADFIRDNQKMLIKVYLNNRLYGE